MTRRLLSADVRLSYEYAITDIQKQAFRALNSCLKTYFDALE